MVTNWLAEMDGHRVRVDVPASSANLGAGYDCLAVALDLGNRVEVEVRGWSRGEIELTVDGEGANELSADRVHRPHRARPFRPARDRRPRLRNGVDPACLVLG